MLLKSDEMERQRNLIMQDPTIKCPPEYDEHPVFITNQKMNAVITRRRSKVKALTTYWLKKCTT